jgi:hypothetical protein
MRCSYQQSTLVADVNGVPKFRRIGDLKSDNVSKRSTFFSLFSESYFCVSVRASLSLSISLYMLPACIPHFLSLFYLWGPTVILFSQLRNYPLIWYTVHAFLVGYSWDLDAWLLDLERG